MLFLIKSPSHLLHNNRDDENAFVNTKGKEMKNKTYVCVRAASPRPALDHLSVAGSRQHRTQNSSTAQYTAVTTQPLISQAKPNNDIFHSDQYYLFVSQNSDVKKKEISTEQETKCPEPAPI
ncbi:hypothetical protein CDAR_564061 [Caerostris darwini]|uniref:Uncharacterized protein n=1 Tax=Caerostris darwini TaxID=1538125 RepID=A0AAV4M5C9_9ARAC|nr:hypothetical protein CDAR_564061 [Caerostris darwini]